MRIQMAIILGGVTLFGGATPVLAQCTVGPSWKLRSSTGPSPRKRHAMAFDSSRGVVVLYGGECCNSWTNLSNYLDDTWEWDGIEWTLRAANSPPGRLMSHAMAFDNVRNRVVMYGGFGVDDLIRRSETWEWNGASWSRRTTTVPSRRNWHALVFDSAMGGTLMFGGQLSRYVTTSETWLWNGSTWSLRTTDGPSARTAHAMTYDVDRRRGVLFSGQTSPANQETWEWNGVRWELRAVDGPPSSIYAAMAYYGAGSQALLFTEEGASGPQGDTWLWDGTTWTMRSSATDPCRREGHAMAYDSLREVVVMFGGHGCGVDGMNGETWEYGDSGDILDCNANEIDDQCEIDPADPDGDGLVIPDCNSNGVLDECETIADADIDGSGVTDLIDFGFLFDCLNGPGVVPSPTDASCAGFCLIASDLDTDGDADLSDVAAFYTAFGQAGS